MAVVVPDPLYLEKWAPSHGFPSDPAGFCEHQVTEVWVVAR